jgi:hypothetical protein
VIQQITFTELVPTLDSTDLLARAAVNTAVGDHLPGWRGQTLADAAPRPTVACLLRYRFHRWAPAGRCPA